MTLVQQYNQWWCAQCQAYRLPAQGPPAGPGPAAAPTTPATGGLWFQNYYRLRKKALAVVNQYWIEDAAGRSLGYSRQKFLRLKEDIRVYSDDQMTQELFRLQQLQVMDMWGRFAVVDSATNAPVGMIRRKALSSAFVRDEWEVYDAGQQLIGGIYEEKGRGLLRKWLPGGQLIPEKMTLSLGGRPVATIDQQFKVVGDLWEVNCTAVPATFDRRVLLGGCLLMSMVERARK
jgi:uncharacterized protein YxjI